MKIYKLSIFKVEAGMPIGNAVLIEHFSKKDSANKRKVETLKGLAALLGSTQHYLIEIQEIDVQE